MASNGFDPLKTYNQKVSDSTALAESQNDSLQFWKLDQRIMQDQVQEQLQNNQQKQLALEAQTDANAQTAVTIAPGANPYGVPRVPWIFATFDSITGSGTGQTFDKNAIVWYANPKSVDWTISQRGSEAKTKAGSVLHIWRDRLRRTDYDDPKITMTFQTGNIMPLFDNGVDPQGPRGKPLQGRQTPPGLNDFYKFLQLVDASKIKNGKANMVQILYKSRIFPAMTIVGFFDPQAVVKFSDSSDNPFQVNSWAATFTIYKTVPALNNWSLLAKAFETEFKGSENSPSSDPLNREAGPRATPVTVSDVVTPGNINIGNIA